MGIEQELCGVIENLGATDPVTATDLRRFAGKVAGLFSPSEPEPAVEPVAKPNRKTSKK